MVVQCDFGFNDDGFPSYEERPLKLLFIIFGGMSMSACIYVCVSFCAIRHRPSFMHSSSMIFFLAFTDFFLSFDFLIEGVSLFFTNQVCLGELCLSRAVLGQYFSLSSFFWTACMSHSSYCTVRQWGQTSRNSGSSVRLMLLYHWLCWGGAALLVGFTAVSVPGAGATSLIVSSSETSCWIVNQEIFAKMLFYLLPLVLVELYNVYVLQYLARALRGLPQEFGGQLLTRFRRYLVMVIWTRAMFLLHRGQVLFSREGRDMFVLTLVSSLGAPLLGLVDACIFRDAHAASRTPLAGRDRDNDSDRGGEGEGGGRESCRRQSSTDVDSEAPSSPTKTDAEQSSSSDTRTLLSSARRILGHVWLVRHFLVSSVLREPYPYLVSEKDGETDQDQDQDRATSVMDSSTYVALRSRDEVAEELPLFDLQASDSLGGKAVFLEAVESPSPSSQTPMTALDSSRSC